MINYWSIFVCAVLAMVFGFVWYGPLFGKIWMKVCGATEMDKVQRKEMQKKAMPLYFIQFVLVLFQVYVFSHLAGFSAGSGILSALWVWGGFVMPTVAASCMWNNDSRKIAWTRFLIQAGYQLVLFTLFGAILGAWI